MTFTPYSSTGPFVNNVTPPGVSATFLNNVENFLAQVISSAVIDSNVTANGAGALTALILNAHTANFLSGSITRISKFGPYTITGSASWVNHNLGAVPDLVLFNNSDLHTTIIVATYEYSSMTSTQVKMLASGNINIVGLAIKF